jgi:hypothetical protein
MAGRGRRPIYFSKEESRIARNTQQKRRRAGEASLRAQVYEVSARPSARALADRDAHCVALAALQLTPNIIVLGDPPPWRSALARHLR